MFMKKLQQTKCPIAQAALVSKARANVQRLIAKMQCPNDLLAYSQRVYAHSKLHPAANALQQDAQAATQKAVAIQAKPEHMAKTIVREGAAVFRKHGKHPNYRLYQMYNRYGSWTMVHKRLIETGFGGKNFVWLSSQNKLQLTSEWFIARHAPELVCAETLAALNALLSSDERSFSKAA